MDIRKDKFLASLLAFGLMGAAACGGDAEATEAEAAPATTGGDDIMAEPEPMGMEEAPMEEEAAPMEEETGDMGAEDDLGPTPE